MIETKIFNNEKYISYDELVKTIEKQKEIIIDLALSKEIHAKNKAESNNDYRLNLKSILKFNEEISIIQLKCLNEILKEIGAGKNGTTKNKKVNWFSNR